VLNSRSNQSSSGDMSSPFFQDSQGGFVPGGGSLTPPGELSLPINLEDYTPDVGIINPLGLVRSSKDNNIGHPGIDFPIKKGSEHLAVADGEIIEVTSAGDPWGGEKITQLLEITGEGKGWTFIYEHAKSVVKEGDKVVRGQVVAINQAPERFTNHFGLVEAFNDYQYSGLGVCWPDLLKDSDKSELDSWFDQVKTSERFLERWRNVNEEGAYSSRELLNVKKYPNGPQLCYPENTDVRIPVN